MFVAVHITASFLQVRWFCFCAGVFWICATWLGGQLYNRVAIGSARIERIHRDGLAVAPASLRGVSAAAAAAHVRGGATLQKQREATRLHTHTIKRDLAHCCLRTHTMIIHKIEPQRQQWVGAGRCHEGAVDGVGGGREGETALYGQKNKQKTHN
jgi:hypothetical protein